MIVTDASGRQFDVTLEEPILRPSGAVQTVWLTDSKAVTLQSSDVASLAACSDKASWPGWESHLAKVE